MTIIEFLRRTYKTRTPWNIPVIRPLVKCADGFTMSVQASASHYCIPRKDGEGYYSAVEVGYVSETTPEFFEYSGGGGVYGCVPINEVQEVCDKHGGIVGADFSNDVAGYWTEEERSGKGWLYKQRCRYMRNATDAAKTQHRARTPYRDTSSI